MSSIELFHATGTTLAVAVPVAAVLSPHAAVLPVDIALGVAIPVHMHYGLSGVVEDYVPEGPARGGAMLGLYALSGLAIFGLLKVNLCGAGITESVKTLWREKPTTEDASKTA
jgi:succinate dehydrogenase (ubiquinone) membrane anchor subunit